MQKVLLRCFEYIRKVPGKAYFYEIERFFEEANLPIEQHNFLKIINGWKNVDFVTADDLSAGVHPKLQSYFTTIQYRPALDLLIEGYQFELKLRNDTLLISTDGTNWESQEQFVQSVNGNHCELGDCTGDLIAELRLANNSNKNEAIILDLSRRTFADFSLQSIVEESGIVSSAVFDIRANGALFIGERADFSHTHIANASFMRASFKCSSLRFDESIIDFALSNNNARTVSFREAHFAGKEASFSSMVFIGERGTLSFEDAVFKTDMLINFSKTDFGETTVNFFQTIARASSFLFAECTINAFLSFEDSVVNSVLFSDIKTLPACNLVFQNAYQLIIHSSGIDETVSLGNIEQLSLNRSAILGNFELRWHNEDGSLNETGIIQAISAFAPDEDITDMDKEKQLKAMQFALLREYFNSQGQYFLADRALIKHREYKDSKWWQKPLTAITSLMLSKRSILYVLLLAACCIALFGVIFRLVELISPVSILSSEMHGGFLGWLIYSSAVFFSLSPSIAVANNTVGIITEIEGVFSWFSLGLLSAAIVHKLLR